MGLEHSKFCKDKLVLTSPTFLSYFWVILYNNGVMYDMFFTFESCTICTALKLSVSIYTVLTVCTPWSHCLLYIFLLHVCWNGHPYKLTYTHTHTYLDTQITRKHVVSHTLACDNAHAWIWGGGAGAESVIQSNIFLLSYKWLHAVIKSSWNETLSKVYTHFFKYVEVSLLQSPLPLTVNRAEHSSSTCSYLANEFSLSNDISMWKMWY